MAYVWRRWKWPFFTLICIILSDRLPDYTQAKGIINLTIISGIRRSKLRVTPDIATQFGISEQPLKILSYMHSTTSSHTLHVAQTHTWRGWQCGTTLLHTCPAVTRYKCDGYAGVHSTQHIGCISSLIMVNRSSECSHVKHNVCMTHNTSV